MVVLGDRGLLFGITKHVSSFCLTVYVDKFISYVYVSVNDYRSEDGTLRSTI
jgi:hypothetical protein